MTASIGGRYRLEEIIGRGASAQVWRAHDTTLDRVVALKRLAAPHETAPSAPEDHRRSAREAHLAARLSHPHVVAVFDLVTDDDGVDWLVMEHIEGRDLASIVRERGPLLPEDAGRYLGQVAGALAAAHAAGIVHRDVKPSNILLRHDDQALLSDFGIARATADPSLTRTGLVTGSPAYLAPEVAAGASATPASDAWSWGATLYHLLTGRSPYARDGDDHHVLGTLYRIVNEPPPRLDGLRWPADLLEVTLVHDPAARWDLARIHQGLLPAPGPTSVSPSAPARSASTPVPADEATLDATAILPRARPPGTPDPGRTAVAPAAARPVPAAPAAERRAHPPVGRIAAAAAVLVLLVGGIWAGTRGGGDGAPPRASSTAAGTPAADRGDTPSAQAMTSFAETYVRTAVDDPAAGYRMLTPAYQRASGGMAGYRSFWSRVVAVKSLEDLRADPAALTVSYRYDYVLRGAGRRTEDVRLRLEYRRDGSFRISGAV